jgi:large conductance mechanosensitive channel
MIPCDYEEGRFLMGVVKSIGSTMNEFRSFILKANAVDLAIGVALGSAFTAVVTAIVTGFFTPLIAAIFGASNFSTLSFTLNGSHIYYGLVINALFTLVIVGLVLFFLVVKPMAIYKRRSGYEPPVDPEMAECPACLTSINVGASRCPACTESLGTGWSVAS